MHLFVLLETLAVSLARELGIRQVYPVGHDVCYLASSVFDACNDPTLLNPPIVGKKQKALLLPDFI